MEEEAKSMASSSVAPPSLQDEEITLRIRQVWAQTRWRE